MRQQLSCDLWKPHRTHHFVRLRCPALLATISTMYTMRCTAVLLMQMAAVHPGAGVAGSANVSVQYEGAGVLLGGSPAINQLAYRTDRRGGSYMFQTYAEISSISPSTGSRVGGTFVTITGHGFPSLDLALGDTLSVQLYGVPCAVLSSNYTTITCRSGPAPSTPPQAYATAINGLYPGMRGIAYEFYRNTSVSYGAALLQLGTNITVANSPSGSYRAIVTDVAEGREFTSPNSCSRMRMFFTAPEAGNYRFMATCDDYCRLDGTWLLPVGRQQAAPGALMCSAAVH